MARVGECAWTRKICAEMRACGATVIPYVGSAAQPRGYPDRIVVWRYTRSVQGIVSTGCAVAFVEFKSATGQLRALQAERLRELRSKGALAVVAKYPDLLLDDNSVVIGRFDAIDGVGTGAGLLRVLAELF